MKGYLPVQPTSGEVKSEVIGAKVLRAGTYKARISDVQNTFVTFSTPNGVHIEGLTEDLLSKCRVGTVVNVTISHVPGAALVRHAGELYAVRDAEGKNITPFQPIADCIEFIQENGLGFANIKVTAVEPNLES